MTVRVLVRSAGGVVRDAVLLAVAAALHLAALLPLAALPDPSAALQAPELTVADLTVELAAVEAEDVTAPPPVPENRPGAPLPYTAEPLPAFLADPESGVPMPAPAESVARIVPTVPAVPMPELAEAAFDPNAFTLPEISLPPAAVMPAECADGGATARIEHPRLAVRLESILKTYPAEARRRGWEGDVTVEVTVDAESRVTAVRVVSGSGRDVLDRAACTMLRNAPFAGGPGTLTQTVRFRLR